MLKSWIVYVVLLVATGIINRIQPGYISSIGFYIVFVTPLISFLHVFFTYVVFRLTHDVDRRQVSKGDIVVYNIKISNPTNLLLAPFSLHYIASKKLFSEAALDVDRYLIVEQKKRVTINKSLTCNYRGNYYVGVDYIAIHDYFNFFTLKYKELEQHKILVYPKLRELKSDLLRNVMNESNESVVSQSTQSQSVFTDIKDYQPGDPLNRIHWKLSAKKGEWLSKDFSGQMTNRTKVFLDTYNLNLDDESTIVFEDYLVEGAVSLIHFLLENRVDTTLYYERLGIHTLKGMSSMDFGKFYDDLAKLSFYKERKFIESIQTVLQNDYDSCHVIVMTQIISLQLAETLVKLKYRNYEVSVILVNYKSIEIEGLEELSDRQSMFMLTTSRIPVYFIQHDESSTRLGVS